LPEGAVRRISLLLLAVGLVAGCAVNGDKSQWDDFWKDLRGDNMKMMSDRTGKEASQQDASE
jgi:hypothetical protein